MSKKNPARRTKKRAAARDVTPACRHDLTRFEVIQDYHMRDLVRAARSIARDVVRGGIDTVQHAQADRGVPQYVNRLGTLARWPGRLPAR